MHKESAAVRCYRCGKVIGVVSGDMLTVKWSGRTVITPITPHLTVVCERCHARNEKFFEKFVNRT